MASFDDGHTCTIETDSEGPSMTPTSSIMRTSVEGQKDNYLRRLSSLPVELQIENNDAVIINAEGDVQSARSFQNQLLKTTLVTRDKEEVKPKVKLISQIPGFDKKNLNNMAIAFKKTNYIFLFFTKRLDDPKSILSSLETILNPYVVMKNVIPVNTKNKKTRDYELGPYAHVTAIEFWSTDQFFVKSVRRLFEMKIDDRLKRDRDLEDERREYLERRNQQIGPLGHRFHTYETTASSIRSLPEQMKGLEVRENSGLRFQNQPVHNPGPHMESISDSHNIQVDGPTFPSAMPAPHPYPHAHQFSQHSAPVNQYGFGEIPVEQMLSHTLPSESGSQRWRYMQQTVPRSPFHHASSDPSMQRSYSSQSPSSSLQVQPPASDFPTNHTMPYLPYTHVQNENASIPAIPVVYHPHYPAPAYPHPHMASPYHPFHWDPSQVIRLPGGLRPSYTIETTHGHSVPSGNQTQASPSLQSTSTSHTSGASFEFARDNSVPQSSSSPSSQSGIVQVITININKVGNAAIGSNPQLINKNSDFSDEEDDGHEGDSDSSDTLSSQEKNPGLDGDRSGNEAPKFMRSSGGRVSTVDGVVHPSPTQQPVSVSNKPAISQSRDFQESHSQRDMDSTQLKHVTPLRDEDGDILTHETEVKQTFKDESGFDDTQTSVKKGF